MWISAALASAGCADLEHATADVCGNEVIDAVEDCDGHASSASAVCAPPGDAHACRYLCGPGDRATDGSPAACPAGFGCGVDGVCRQFTGSFSLATPPSAVSSFSLSSALFDTDGKPIVFVLGDDLGDGRRFPWEVDPDGANVATGTAVPTPMAQPSIMDLDQDGFQDVAFVDYPGIGILRGQPDTSLPPFLAFPSALFPSKSVTLRAIAVDAGPGPHGEDDGDSLVILEDDGESFALRRLDAPDQALLDLTATQKREADVSGDVVQAKFDARPGQCAGIVIPLQGLSYVPVFSPCNAGVWNATGAAVDVALVAGGADPTVQGRAIAMDVDGDQNLDLVVDTTAGPYVAFGRGDGTFGSSTDPTATANAAAPLSLSWEDGETPATDVPLAGADLNADGKTDFVFPEGIALADSTGSLYWAFRSSGWLEGQIAHGEGGTPVVVGTSNSAGIDFLVYSPGTRQFVSTWVPTANLAAHLAIGDFDGDAVDDVAFVEHSESSGDTWSVIYGSEAYVPSAPVAMATFDAVLQLSPAHLAAPYIGSDAIADLVISAQLATANTDTLATSLGSSTRQMLAPFQLRDANGAQVLPLSVTTGKFIGSSPSLAVRGAAAPQGGGTLRVWFFTPDSAAATDLVMGDPLSPLFHPTSFGGNTSVNLRYGAHMATGDFNGDGVDDAVLVAPFGPDDSQSAIVVARVSGASVQASAPLVFEVPSTLYSVLRVADIDGDGAPDILFKGFDDDTAAAVNVFWNDGSGGFDASRTTALNVDGGVKDFVCAPGTSPCTLYAVSEEKAFAIAVAKDHTATVREVPSVQGGWSITTGDFDGDGLADLAVGAPTDLRLYYAIARLP